MTVTFKNEPLCPALFSWPSSSPDLGTGKLRASCGFVPSEKIQQKQRTATSNFIPKQLQ